MQDDERPVQSPVLTPISTLDPDDDLIPRYTTIGAHRSPDGRIGLSDYVFIRCRVVGLTEDGLCMVQGIPKQNEAEPSGKVYYVEQEHCVTLPDLKAIASKA